VRTGEDSPAVARARHVEGPRKHFEGFAPSRHQPVQVLVARVLRKMMRIRHGGRRNLTVVGVVTIALRLAAPAVAVASPCEKAVVLEGPGSLREPIARRLEASVVAVAPLARALRCASGSRRRRPHRHPGSMFTWKIASVARVTSLGRTAPSAVVRKRVLNASFLIPWASY
jgi:hypothetical protein